MGVSAPSLHRESTDSLISGYTDPNQPHHHYDDLFPGVCFLGEPLEYLLSSKQVTISPPNLGVTLSIPSDAVPRGEHVTVTIRPCLSGPFQYPEGYEPLSAVYHISTNTSLKKKGQLTLEHFGDLQTKKEADNMTFFSVKSPVMVDGKKVYQFGVVKGGKFRVGENYGAISLEHFCFVVEGIHSRNEVTGDEVATEQTERSWQISKPATCIMLCCLVISLILNIVRKTLYCAA